MTLGMSIETFTLVHVLLSLVGIGSGFVVAFGLLQGKRMDGWTALFLGTTLATSVTAFGFPFDHLLPSHKVGIVSLAVLAVTIVARYPLHLAGAWRRIYAAGVTLPVAPRLRADIAYERVDLTDRRGRTTDGGVAFPTAAINNGLYHYDANLLGVSLVYGF